MKSEPKKCAHPACNCMTTEDTGYCSHYCSDAKGTMEISCNCGHGGCAITEGESVMTGAPTY